MAVSMAADLKSKGVLAPSRDGVRTSFFIGEIENESSDRINKRLILTKIRTQIKRAMGNDVMVLDRSPTANELVDAERRMKDRQQVSGENTRKIAGSDFVLKGVMMSRDRQAGSLRSSFINVTFELTDLGTGEMVWTDEYEMKTESEKSVINR
jgi:penicillin-binding protein activator